ncbi:MAG: hypothetical protein RQ750_16870 [Roseovarius sp.]|nr:hypothetical protein [Roseovarius sp.]
MTYRPPKTCYQVWCDFPAQGVPFGNGGDPFEDIQDAASVVAEYTSEGHECRVLRLDFDVETREFECARDVTDDVMAMIPAEDEPDDYCYRPRSYVGVTRDWDE